MMSADDEYDDPAVTWCARAYPPPPSAQLINTVADIRQCHIAIYAIIANAMDAMAIHGKGGDGGSIHLSRASSDLAF